ncbi:hypothetical protein LJC71_04810 [Desulfosarcina sp. OttesenSCG-928-A07]|nr:hypothetical protein [Desulfosarcina sp. OttesenSCG-928-G17]MDL2329058.1 hypothetical protein [Desulfosarcina sp. OttesenSCG-928-A07]
MDYGLTTYEQDIKRIIDRFTSALQLAKEATDMRFDPDNFSRDAYDQAISRRDAAVDAAFDAAQRLAQYPSHNKHKKGESS